MHFEAVDGGLVATPGLCREEGRVLLEEDVVEGCAKVCAVDGGMARGLGVVEVFAARTVQLDRVYTCYIGYTHWKKMLLFAVNARALSERAFFVLLGLPRRGRGRGGVSGLHQLRGKRMGKTGKRNEREPNR